jgi:NAD(P)-dependent dehydrogenase (short-subunit alcohol dehydrogenase family)
VDLGLAGRVALVAGSSAGLGRANAERFAADGILVTCVVPGYFRTGRVTALASERASHLTGAVLAVDGGHLRSIG